MKRKILSICLAACLLFSLSGCSTRNSNTVDSVETVTVRYLNFKPEIASVYEAIANDYKKETGRSVVIETAANNTYEQTLTAKMATSAAPTIFQINGPLGYENWATYCADLKDTQLYAALSDPALALTSGDGVYGIPYVVEGYGIIYNDAIMQRYFALENRSTSFQSMDEIRNFEALKALAEDLQAHKDDLGIQGAFASTSLKSGEDWRWQTHLANIPISYEFRNNNIEMTGETVKTITFEYGENFQNIFDLYLNNSVTDPKLLGTKLVDESMSEFALGECAMVQNGNWAWSQINAVDTNTVLQEDIRFLPIYTGIDGEETQGLCIGTENYLCINAKADELEQQAAADFLYWLFSSDTGKSYVTNELGFIAPFNTFSDDERPDDPLAKEVIRYMENDQLQNIPWNFTIFPGQTFKEDFGAALLQYAQGTKSWEEVSSLVVTRWKEESALL